MTRAPNAKYHAEGLEESRVISDGSRKFEIYHMKGGPHSSAMLITYLRKEKVLTEGGPWTPGLVNPMPNDRAYQRCCDAQNLYDNVKRFNLEVKAFAPIHGRIDTWENFLIYLCLQPEGASIKHQKGGN